MFKLNPMDGFYYYDAPIHKRILLLITGLYHSFVFRVLLGGRPVIANIKFKNPLTIHFTNGLIYGCDIDFTGDQPDINLYDKDDCCFSGDIVYENLD